MEEAIVNQASAQVVVEIRETSTWITLDGDIDVSLAPELATAVGQAEAAALPTVVDGRRIAFMDSSGIALLARLASRTPAPLRVVDPPEVVRFLLEVTRIGDMVEIISGDDDDDGPTAA